MFQCANTYTTPVHDFVTRYGEMCCFHLQDRQKEVAYITKKLLTANKGVGFHNSEDININIHSYLNSMFIPYISFKYHKEKKVFANEKPTKCTKDIFSVCSTYMFRSCLTIIRVHCYRVSNTTICKFVQGIIVHKYVLHNSNIVWYFHFDGFVCQHIVCIKTSCGMLIIKVKVKKLCVHV